MLVKALIGAGVVVLISLLSKTRNYHLAGLAPLFPSFALIAHYLVGVEKGKAALKSTLIFSMWSLLPYFLYLGTMWLLVDRLPLPGAIAAGVAAWVVAAAILIALW